MAKIEFGGKIGDDWRTSEPWWPPLPTPPDGAPNVVLIVLDDVGFAQLGCYGSDIDTPVIDGLAADGIRLANFHTTALCSPTRACLLTGRNHHRSGMGRVADLAIGFPGYWGRPPRENGFLSEILRANGYATYAVGKWHLSPEEETNMAASRATWPLGRGFDRWYGFHGGEAHQFAPALYHDNHSVRPGRSIEDGYHLSADLADRAIEFLGDLRAVDAELPFFLYFATGACHSPHHAPKEWIERYAGHFAQGWDSWREETFARQLALGIVPEGTELSPRPPWVPSWDSLDERERALAERFMECFAAYLSYTDQQIGRVLDFIADLGDADDTVVILVSDNGASSEGGRDGTINEGRLSNFESSGVDEMYRRIDEIGGPLSHNNYPWGWTMAGNTPFKRWKREVHEGGVADPCIVRVPASRRSGAGEVRRQYAHAIDILPTVLELVGIDPPPEIDGIAQSHLDGTSFAYVLDEGGADEPGRHHTQHFEMLGSRAIYHDGWKAVTYHPVGPVYDDGLRASASFDDDVWELYHVAEDVSEVHDRAAEFPAKVAELDVAVVGGGEAQRRAPPRQPRPRGDGPQARQTAAPADLPVLPGRRPGARVGGGRRAQPLPPDLRHGRGPRRRRPVRRAPRARLRHRRVVPAPPRRPAALRAQPAQPAALHGHRRHGARIGPAPPRIPVRQGRGRRWAGRPRRRRTAGGEADIRRFTPVTFNEVGIGLTCGYEWGPSVGGDYEAPFAVQRHHRPRRGHSDGPGAARSGGGGGGDPGDPVDARAVLPATLRGCNASATRSRS